VQSQNGGKKHCKEIERSKIHFKYCLHEAEGFEGETNDIKNGVSSEKGMIVVVELSPPQKNKVILEQTDTKKNKI
jgi:hypothetical protein